LIGATKASYVDRKLFGNVPQAVAADAPVPTVVVQHRTGTVKALLRRAEWRVSQIEDTLKATISTEEGRVTVPHCLKLMTVRQVEYAEVRAVSVEVPAEVERDRWPKAQAE
jgi:hypothetical protein